MRDRTGSPSTPGQLDLQRMLVGELRATGLTDAALDAIDAPHQYPNMRRHLESYPDVSAAGSAVSEPG